MKFVAILVCTIVLSSCARYGRITIQNHSDSSLKIATVPIIRSMAGGWENYIRYFRHDSIMWVNGLGYPHIKAQILEPNTWQRSIPDTSGHRGVPYTDYGIFRDDTTVRGVYSMFPNSQFMIGQYHTGKKMLQVKDEVKGWFFINKLIVYREHDTLVANNQKEIWNLLLMLDENPDNFDKKGKRKKIRHWTVFMKP